MDFENYKKIIKKHTWWSEECPGKVQYCYWMLSAVEQQEYLCPGLLSICSVLIKDGYAYEMSSEQEKLEQYYWLKKQYQNNYGYIDDEHASWLTVRDEVSKFTYQIINYENAWSLNELQARYNDLLNVAIKSCCWGFFLECIDVYSEQFLCKKIQEQFTDLDDVHANDIAITMSAPVIISFMEEFQIDKAKVILKHRGVLHQPDRALKIAIGELISTYQSLSVNYAGSAPYTEDDILKQLQKEAKHHSDQELKDQIERLENKIETMTQKQAEVSAKYQFNQDLLDDFTILRAIGGWMDERKQSMIQVSLALRILLRNIAEAIDIPAEQLEWYTIIEINDLLNNKKIVAHDEIKKREHCSAFIVEYEEGAGTRLTVFTEDEAAEAQGLFFNREKKQLKGTIASTAEQQFFTGQVQVVLDITKDEFEDGKILVTSMTRPEFVPLLKRAKAIITDEGGLTCHAAVVSRELGIPCIIGTKHATKDLKSGDFVEMNLKNGEIILK